MLAIALLPLSAIAGASQDATTSDVSTIQNLSCAGSAPKVRPKTQNTTGWQERPDFGKYFQQAGVEGTFLLYDLKQKQYLVYNPQRANTSIIPVSTFKIFNSLVALETGVIQDENEVIKSDGTPQKFPNWNQDQTMRSAIAGSVIWFYQELARRIGQERMQRYINLANYGNQDISGGIDQFWLKGDLRISPKQQIDLLVKLYQNKLPFSQKTMATVKEILINEKTNDYILRGKTGWGWDFTPQVGWYVGYLERGDRVYFFALNMDINKPEDTKARMAITKDILRSMGLLGAGSRE
ncbi:MAG: Beta-lactamase OXA-10 [Chroococcidiopsis sp. SAG 2025]|nr:Beta-lactamase OXA-10 [Chroococcidiopsis sp. SAG 2025]